MIHIISTPFFINYDEYLKCIRKNVMKKVSIKKSITLICEINFNGFQVVVFHIWLFKINWSKLCWMHHKSGKINHLYASKSKIMSSIFFLQLILSHDHASLLSYRSFFKKKKRLSHVTAPWNLSDLLAVILELVYYIAVKSGNFFRTSVGFSAITLCQSLYTHTCIYTYMCIFIYIYM